MAMEPTQHTSTFDLNVACYTLTTGVNPASSGTVNASPAPNCGAQYTAGECGTLSAAPGTGFVFDRLEWGCERDEQPDHGDDGWE